ncbi:MAG: hypothetical protein ACYDAY_08915 [Candidatus Dormibacteria bacterium]
MSTQVPSEPLELTPVEREAGVKRMRRSATTSPELSGLPDRYLVLWLSSYVVQAFAIALTVALVVVAFLIPAGLLVRLAVVVLAGFAGVLVYGLGEFIHLQISLERSARHLAENRER